MFVCSLSCSKDLIAWGEHSEQSLVFLKERTNLISRCFETNRAISR